MSKTTIRNLIIASAALLIAASVFAYMLFVSESQNSLLNEQLVALEKKQAQEASYLQMRRVVEDSSQDIAQLQAMFLERESDSIELLNLVESIAAENNLSLETDSLEVVSDKKTKQSSLLLGFSFNGARDDVQHFIEVLEQLQYLAEIKQFNLKARSTTNWEATVMLEVNLYEYAE